MRALFLALLLGSWLFALEVPALNGRVIDNAGLFTPDQITSLDQRLARIEDNATHQFAVLTIQNLGDASLESYAIEVAQSWKLGQKDKDNGVLILIVKESHDIRIEVGYGLEGAIPDGLAGSIIRTEMVPSFKEGNYFKGVENAVIALEAAAKGEYKNAAVSDEDEMMLPVAFFLFVVLIIMAARSIKLALQSGAIFGAALGLFAGGGSWVELLTYTAMGVIAALFAIAFTRGKSSSGDSSFSNDTDDFGSGSSASSSGGFSGGGGSFGGGGASGKW